MGAICATSGSSSRADLGMVFFFRRTEPAEPLLTAAWESLATHPAALLVLVVLWLVASASENARR